MISKKKLILLCDLENQVDLETGDRKKVVVHARKVIGSKELVGVQTQILSQLQNMNFQYSIVIDRMFYDDQKYLYIDNKVYVISSITNATLDKDCKLNVSILQDADIENAIKEYLKDDIQWRTDWCFMGYDKIFNV